MKKTQNESRDTSSTAMDGFVRGMGSFSLFPQLPDPEPEISPWQAVLNAFGAANRNLTDAIYEFRNAQGLTE